MALPALSRHTIAAILHGDSDRHGYKVIFALGSTATYATPYLFEAVSRDAWGTFLPYVGFFILYNIAAFYISEQPLFYELPYQLLRAHIEAGVVILSVYLTEAGDSLIWFLLMLPILQLARWPKTMYLLLFGVEILTAIEGVALLWAGPSPYVAVRWAIFSGFLFFPGIALHLYLKMASGAPSLLVGSVVGTAGTDSGDPNWKYLAIQCRDFSGAADAAILQFKGLSGEFHVLDTTSGPPSRRHEGLECLREAEVLNRLREGKRITIDTTSPASLCLGAIFNRRHTHIVLYPVQNLAELHLLGVVALAYSPSKIFFSRDPGVLPLGDSLNAPLRSLAEILDSTRIRSRDRFLLSAAHRVLESKDIAEATLQFLWEITSFYRIPCALWYCLGKRKGILYFGTGTTKGRMKTRRIYMSSHWSRLRKGDYVTLSRTGASGTTLDALQNAETAIFIPVHWEGDLLLVLALYIEAAEGSQADINNTVRALQASPLLATFRLSLASDRLKRIQKLSNELNREISSLEGGGTLTAAVIVARLAERASQSLAFHKWLLLKKEEPDLEGLDPAVREVISKKLEGRASTKPDTFSTPTFLISRGDAKEGIAHRTVVVLPVKTGEHAEVDYVVLLGESETWSDFVTTEEMAVFQGYLNLLLEARAEAVRSQQYAAALDDLGAISRDILSVREVDGILRGACFAALRLTKAELSTVQLVSPENREELTIVAAAASSGAVELQSRTTTIKEGITGEVAQTGKPLRVKDVSRRKSYIPFFASAASELAVPIFGWEAGKLLGILNVESVELDHFKEVHEELLQKFAVQLGIALEQATKIEELEAARDKLQNTQSLAMIGLLYGEDIHLTSNKLGAARQFARNIVQHSVDLDHARNTARRIERNIQEVLGVIRQIRRSVEPTRPKRIDAAQLVEGVLDHEPRSSLIAIERIYPQQQLIFIGLEKQLAQVLRVVVRNAIEAMDGEGRLAVRIDDDENEDSILVEVGDTGRGIPPEKLKRLFLIEKRVDSKRGFAVGLAWCNLFLSLYGGGIAVEPRPQGTLIKIRIPRDVRASARRLVTGVSAHE